MGAAVVHAFCLARVTHRGTIASGVPRRVLRIYALNKCQHSLTKEVGLLQIPEVAHPRDDLKLRAR